MTKTKGSGARRAAPLAVVWVLNILLTASAFVTLFHWTAFMWIIGEGATGWGILIEVLVVLCLLYLFVIGFCVLGWQKRVYDSYLRLTHFESYQCLLTTSLGLPLLLVFLFGTLGLLALVHTPSTSNYLQHHAQGVFERADTNKDRFVNFEEFSTYQLGLQSFKGDNSTEFRQQLAEAFDDMDSNEDGFLTADNLYSGIVKGMTASRGYFGGAMLTLLLVTVSFSGIFWNWFCFYRARDKADGGNRIEAESLLDNNLYD